MAEKQDENQMSTVSEWIEKYGADVLTERSLARLIKQIEGDEPFAIISAWRHGRSLKVNWTNNAALHQAIRSLGLGAAPMRGAYYEEDAEGNRIRTEEPSWFVYGIDKKSALRLGSRFNQESNLWGRRKLVGGGVFLVYAGGQTKKIGSKVSLSSIKDAYSEMKGKQFTLEAIALIEGGHANSLGWLAELSQAARTSKKKTVPFDSLKKKGRR